MNISRNEILLVVSKHSKIILFDQLQKEMIEKYRKKSILSFCFLLTSANKNLIIIYKAVLCNNKKLYYKHFYYCMKINRFYKKNPIAALLYQTYLSYCMIQSIYFISSLVTIQVFDRCNKVDIYFKILDVNTA